jgi:hypothetical protein
VIRAPIVGNDDGSGRRREGWHEEQTITAEQKPTFVCAGLLLAALLCGTGIAILLLALRQDSDQTTL